MQDENFRDVKFEYLFKFVFSRTKNDIEDAVF